MSGRSLYHVLRAHCGQTVDPLTRRQFVRESLAAAGATLLSLSSNSAAHQRDRDAPRVLVVGAGLAGLACAFELNSAGYRALVIEARDRIGGRVHSLADFLPGKIIEAGGEFIGSNHPAWLAYAERFKLRLSAIPETHDVNSPVIIDGKRLGKLSVIALFQEIQAVCDKITEAARQIDADAPWTSPDAKALDELSMAAWLNSQNLAPLVRRTLEAEFVPYSGVPTAQESFLGALAAVKGGGLDKYWTENEAFRCTGGNQRLAQRFLDKIGQDNLRLRSTIERIAMTDRGGQVRTAAGEVFEADDIVLAVPPSTWSHIHFEPALPKALVPQMGRNVKFLIAARDAFWDKSDASPFSLSDGLINVTWSATDSQPGGDEQGMIAFAGGPAADKLREIEADERETILRRDLEFRYPAFRASYLRSKFIDWPGQRFTRGSYATPAPGQVTSQGPALAAGLGRLHFAGEHTCLKFVGFMEGALTSGATVARRLAMRDGIVS